MWSRKPMPVLHTRVRMNDCVCVCVRVCVCSCVWCVYGVFACVCLLWCKMKRYTCRHTVQHAHRHIHKHKNTNTNTNTNTQTHKNTQTQQLTSHPPCYHRHPGR